MRVRTPGDYPLHELWRSLANLANGSLGGSHDRSLGFPLQHFLIEDLGRNRRKPSDPALHVVPVVVRAIMLSYKPQVRAIRSTICFTEENLGVRWSSAE